MSYLKNDNVNKCVSLLREYIETPSNNKKQIAVLALDQLQKVSAGSASGIDDGSAEVVGMSCTERPKANGNNI
jgi:hypothetical protein